MTFNHSIPSLLAAGLLTIVLAGGCSAATGDSVLREFVTARDGRLFEGEQPFRFLSFNIPNLLLIEDNVAFTELNPWRLPDPFEINDALETVRVMGGTVVRTYVISVRRTNDTPDIPRHVLTPGHFDEASFRALDEVLAAANRTGVRLIIPLVDNWSWMGGRAEYGGFRGGSRDAFWTDPDIIADFKKTIYFILARTNTVTGVRYRDDKAVLCWETGNEVPSPASWTREIARYVKSLDTNHLVMDGFHTPVLRDESLEIPDVDIVTTHHYPGRRESFAELIRANAARAKGRKPYVIGEFGFVPTEQMIAAMDAIADSSASGGLLWSLRFRNRDGGFYWHSEPYGNDLYKAFHWPGSAVGEPYEEAELMNAARERAFAIRGLSVPPVPVPAAPKLLPILDAAAISWQGSVGAAEYQVERAASPNGPWQLVAENVDEAFVQYRPQFSDENVPAGTWYYRVRARNQSGVSEPSNVGGPVTVTAATVVDELADFSKTQSRSGNWQMVNNDCRRAKEDAHRAAGKAGDTLVYIVATSLQGFRVFAFFPSDIMDPKFAVSRDGEVFEEVEVGREVFFQGAGDYSYWKPVRYEGRIPDSEVRFLRIALKSDTQIARVELTHAAEP